MILTMIPPCSFNIQVNQLEDTGKSSKYFDIQANQLEQTNKHLEHSKVLL